MPTYYFDASVQIDVAKALSLVRDDILYPGALGSPIASPNVDDEVWLTAVGAQNYVVVKRDKKIRTRPWERQALIAAGVRSFCMTGAGNYSKWEVLRLLARFWPDMEEVAETIPGPYIYSVTQRGVRFLAA
ncbi:MAG: hypothetical protein ABI635_01290 [Actinomycetota bacterium]